jgi:hypothetical protein
MGLEAKPSFSACPLNHAVKGYDSLNELRLNLVCGALLLLMLGARYNGDPVSPSA